MIKSNEGVLVNIIAAELRTLMVVSFLGVCTLPVLTSVGALFFWQLWGVIYNVTVIESHIFDKLEWVAMREKKEKFTRNNPYDLGLIANLKTIMGSKVSLWLWPFTDLEGNGIDFQMNASALVDIENQTHNAGTLLI